MRITLTLYFMAQALARLCRHADHRPWVVALAPMLFLAGDAAHSVRVFEATQLAALWAGWGLSLGVIPASLALAWWRRRQAHAACQNQGG
jgi:spore germination protein